MSSNEPTRRPTNAVPTDSGLVEISTAICFFGCLLVGGIGGFILSRGLPGEIVVGSMLLGIIFGFLVFVVPHTWLSGYFKKQFSKKRKVIARTSKFHSLLARLFRFDIRWMFALTATVAVPAMGFSIHWALGFLFCILTIPLYLASYCYLHVGLSFHVAAAVCICTSLFVGVFCGFAFTFANTLTTGTLNFDQAIGNAIAGLFAGVVLLVFSYTGLAWVFALTRQ